MSDSHDQKTAYPRRPDAISATVVAGHIGLVMSPMYLGAILGPGWHLVWLAMALGLGMNSILNLMHECAHALVFRKKQLSDVLGRRVLGPLLFADFDAYRQRHWDHHRYLGVDGETKDTYTVDIRGWRVGLLLLRCLSTGVAIAKFRGQSSTTQPAPRGLTWLSSLAVWQGAVVSSAVVVAWMARPADGPGSAVMRAALAYCVVYLYGLMSVTVFMATLRAIAEHQPYDGAPMRGRAALRNFECGPLARCLMGAYGFGEHHTHHREPGIPYYHLAEATDRLAADDTTLRRGKGYFRVLGEIIAGVRPSHLSATTSVQNLPDPDAHRRG